MQKRYKSPYGGVATTIGEFTPTELFRYLGSIGRKDVVDGLKLSLKMANHGPEKVLDMVLPGERELLGYTTTSDYIRLELINKH